MASIYTVAQVNAYIKNMFAQDFALNRITIQGEVSNCKYHTSGHIYFTLKDGGGTLAAVMFAGKRKGLGFQMQDGQQIIVQGSIEVYERDGKYQLYAGEISLSGTGDLFKRFEALRDQLEEMGMFAPEYKNPIPKYAMRVGIVTASTGAAIRDIMNIAARRNPYVQLILYPALVQGEGAAASISSGIACLDNMGLDVLIVGRGGGSIEDLWAFNEEAVARAIFACKTPVISAVGHETDVTIADYVADMRAPTPSAAAELAVFDYLEFKNMLDGIRLHLNREILRLTDRQKHRLEEKKLKLMLRDPGRQINEKRNRMLQLEEEMRRLMEQRLREKRHLLALLSSRLKGLSPLDKISRGFGFLTDYTGQKIETIDKVNEGDEVTVRLSDGKLSAKVLKKEKME